MSLRTSKLQSIKAVLLDRDGVLNRKAPEGSYVGRPEDLELLPGAAEAVRLLNERGILAIVVSNQRGIALGRFSEQDLRNTHAALSAELNKDSAHLDAIYYCPHDYNQCNCRKPKTGLLEQALRDFPQATKDNTILIGDAVADIAAGKAFGIPTILVAGKEDFATMLPPPDDYADSLLNAVQKLLFI